MKAGFGELAVSGGCNRQSDRGAEILQVFDWKGWE